MNESDSTPLHFEEEGRLLYALEFSPKPGLPASSLADRALNAPAGRVLVASDPSVTAEGGRITLPPSTGAWISV